MKRLSGMSLVSVVGVMLGIFVPAPAYAQGCPADSVRSGIGCMDKSESGIQCGNGDRLEWSGHGRQ